MLSFLTRYSPGTKRPQIDTLTDHRFRGVHAQVVVPEHGVNGPVLRHVSSLREETKVESKRGGERKEWRKKRRIRDVDV